MSDKIPTLTLEPFEEDPKDEKKSEEPAIIEEGKVESVARELLNLTPEEKKMVEDFAEKIDLTKHAQVLQYGAGAQKKIADFSESALNNVKTKDLGEIGDMLSGVVSELKTFGEEEEKGLRGLFKRSSNKISAMKAKYNKAEANIDKIVEVLEGHQIQLLKDIAMLDKMYDLNVSYYKELTMYILAGKKKLAKAREEELPKLREKAEKSNLPEDIREVNDFVAAVNRFEKKIHDLELTRMVSIQMAPQIRLIQENNALMVEKIQSTVVNTIPLWKSQMVIALGVYHSGQAAKAHREVTDMTNQLLKKNAETLKMATIETAKESERGIIDIETLRTTNETLITTLNEVLQIQEEGRRKRKEAEAELYRIEEELKAKLLELKG
ncbi:MAG: toxic anion resistance protein [Clostridia bacterium]